MLMRALLAALGGSLLLASPAAATSRTALSLDGRWQVEDSVDADAMPRHFDHNAPVPGLVHSAKPGFAAVDQYQTKQLLDGMARNGLYAQADYNKLGDIRGISHQARNYFWYRRTFRGPSRRAVAILKVAKAQFGTVVFLNGVLIGEHDGCFTAGYFDVSNAIRWDGPNDLVIRIGAHPGVLPASVSGGTDFEKNRWTPGIYDDVALIASDNPAISTVQVAPRIANAANPVGGILVQTELHNYSAQAVTTEVRQQVRERLSGKVTGDPQSVSVTVPAGGSHTVTQAIAMPSAHLWSPDDPFLYTVETSTSGDAAATQFGMREFRFDTVTQRAYLNGRPFFMRGSNIALHRFFEDPEVGTLPWDEKWVHKLLVDIPKKLHWNAFRFTIGPVPDKWLDIADENGLLIENEYAIWSGSPVWTNWKPSYDYDELKTEFREWMRDGWNHASVVIWDASNESDLPELSRKVVAAVRGGDLSHRPWENSYNDPTDPDDPIEDHQYLMESLAGGFDNGGKTFALTDMEGLQGPGPNPFLKAGHAWILNEYGWMWLNRDGTPTLLTDKLYPKLLGARNDTEHRRELYAYLLAGETEFWRAYRRYAGVMSFPYLTASDPKGFTSDQFVNVKSLTLEPHFAEAMERAFDPLGVYLNFWQPTMAIARRHELVVSMVNDEDRARTGRLRFVFTDGAGKQTVGGERPFTLAPLGAETFTTAIAPPVAPGNYKLEAIAVPDDDPSHAIASRRNVMLETPNRETPHDLGP